MCQVNDGQKNMLASLAMEGVNPLHSMQSQRYKVRRTNKTPMRHSDSDVGGGGCDGGSID